LIGLPYPKISHPESSYVNGRVIPEEEQPENPNKKQKV
jgi:hypothetical protein